MSILGLDVGGANLKAADVSGRAMNRPFPIWKDRDRLRGELDSILNEFPETDRIALTMTAELADCFATKSEGVRFVIDAVEVSLNHKLGRSSTSDESIEASRLQIWSTEGKFISRRLASDYVRRVASANWHALATWCGQLVPDGSNLLIDIGSTTTDIIPIENGLPTSLGLTDVDRMKQGELSYSGISRTPLCAVAHSIPFRDGYCPLAAELFATTLDMNLLLDRIPEDASNTDTANGQPATREAAHDRIVRMVCCDRHEVPYEEAVQIARFLADVQRQRLAGALERVARRLPSRCETVLLSGSGTFLAKQLIVENRLTCDSRIVPLDEQFSAEVAQAACAYAVARLAAERKSAND